MSHCRAAAALVLAAILSSVAVSADERQVVGDVEWPSEWVIFGPAGISAPPLPDELLRTVPDSITVGDRALQAQRVVPTGHQYDFRPMFGPVVEYQTAYAYLEIEAPEAGEATLGLGADWWMQAWVNGDLLLDTTRQGNGQWPPMIDNHLVRANLQAGKNVLAIRFLSGMGSSVLAAGGPRQLRAPMPPSITGQQTPAEFEQLEARWGEWQHENLRPTSGWAPEFRRDGHQPERARAALRTDWGDNLLEDAAVTFGVPFPRNALPDPAQARLVDAQDRPVPAQIEATATWDGPDGSVKWALVHARLRRNQEYFLEYGSAVAPAELPPIQIAETDREIAVTTGPMRFVVSKAQPTVIHSASLDRNHDGAFGADEVLVTPEQAARALPSVTDAEGNVYAASPDGLKVEVVERGAMRAAIRREGWYVGPDGTRFCQFITYTYFMAGEPGFRHDHTLVVAFDTHRHQIRDVEIPLPLKLQGERRAWFAADESPEGALIEQPVGEQPLSLIEHYRSGWQLLRGEERLATGERSGGWFGLAGERWGAFAGIEHFWQNSPAELEVAGDRLNLHLYASRETELLDFRPSQIYGQRGEEYPGDRVFHSRWYRDGLDEMTQGYGLAKTHSLRFRFFAEPGREAAAQQARTVNKPVMAYADPEWACRTEAFGRVRHYDPQRFPRIEAILDAIVHRRLWLRERLENYGWFHFGDINGNMAFTGDPERVTFRHWRRWASMFHTNTNVMPLLFMRSGRRDAWDFHRVNTRHIADIDICHLDHEEFRKTKGLRYGGDGGIVHFAAGLYGLGCDSHLRFMLHDYYLNGNLRTWEVANYYMESHEALRTESANLRYRHRHTGGPLRLFTEAYQATWDPKYLQAMRQFAEILYQAKEELGATRYCDIYMNEGKVFYYQTTGDERMRELFLSDMRILRERKDLHVFQGTRNTTLYGPSHAFWLTGDREFLSFPLWQLDVAKRAMITEGDPGRIGSVDWTEETPYSATLANQLPVLMAAMADAGEQLPDPEGPTRFETTGAVHFLQEQDGEIRIALTTDFMPGRSLGGRFRSWERWMQRLPEATRPALALVGPDGREVQRVALGTEPQRQLPADLEARIAAGSLPPDLAVIQHPADGQTGVYTVQPTSLAVPLRIGVASSNLARWVADARDAAFTESPYMPYYFRVPAGTGPFSIRYKLSALRGSHKIEIFGPGGEMRGGVERDGPRRTWQTIRLNANRPEQDEAWILYVFPQEEAYFEFDGIDGHLSSSPKTLFAADRQWSAPQPHEPPEGNEVSYRAADELGGSPAADLPARASVRIASPEEGQPLAEGQEGTLEMWVKSHRRPHHILDRTLAKVGGLELYRRAVVGTYLVMTGNFQTGFLPPPGQWTHMAATWRPRPEGGVEVALFVDGVKVESRYRNRLQLPGEWPAETIEVPRGESALSVAGLRVSNRARYAEDFAPMEGPVLEPDESTLALWPVNAEGAAWVKGRTTTPVR